LGDSSTHTRPSHSDTHPHAHPYASCPARSLARSPKHPCIHTRSLSTQAPAAAPSSRGSTQTAPAYATPDPASDRVVYASLDQLGDPPQSEKRAPPSLPSRAYKGQTDKGKSTATTSKAIWIVRTPVCSKLIIFCRIFRALVPTSTLASRLIRSVRRRWHILLHLTRVARYYAARDWSQHSLSLARDRLVLALNITLRVVSLRALRCVRLRMESRP